MIISWLALVEVTNAIQLRLFRREVTPVSAKAALDNLYSDLAAGTLTLKPVPEAAWKVARLLSLMHTRALGTRSLDILQVASALSLNAESFLTFDRNQALLAQAAGLLTPVLI